MTTVHLEHALLDVRDVSRSLDFYRALIPDWTIRWEGRTMESTRWIHFGPSGGGQPGYLSLYEMPAAAGSVPAGDDDTLRIEHVGFAHPDVKGLIERVAPAGIHPSDQVEDHRFRRAYFADPDGHQLEFVQELR